MKKNRLRIVPLFLSLALTFCLSVEIRSQESTEEQDFVNSSLIWLLSNIEESKSKDENELKLSLEQEKIAKEDLDKTRKKLADASEKLESKKSKENTVMLKLKDIYENQQKNFDKAEIEEASEKLNRAISERVKVETEISILKETEETLQNKVNAEQNRRSEIEERFKIEEPKRVQQKNSLENLAEQWRINPTDENFNSLVEEITNIANDRNQKANIIWKSVQRQGVIVYFQTKRSREKREVPCTSNNPTNTTTPQPIAIGVYYVWSEENGNPISDYNRIFPINIDTTEITINILDNN